MLFAQAVTAKQNPEIGNTSSQAAIVDQTAIAMANAQNAPAESKLNEFADGIDARIMMIPHKVYIIPGQDWLIDEEDFDSDDYPNSSDLCGRGPMRGFKGYNMTNLEQDVSFKALCGLESFKNRTACCLRALAFVHRATRTHEDALLLMTSITKFSTGQVKIDSSSFCSQAAIIFESKIRDWDVCTTIETNSKEQMKRLLGFAKGLVALQWLGKSASESICKNIWDRLMKGHVGGKHVQIESYNQQNICSNCSYKNEAAVQYCKLCNWTIQRLASNDPDYKETLRGLVCCHLLSELFFDGENCSSAEKKNLIGLGLMKHVFESYQQLYPYSSVGKLGSAVFRQQCSCVIQLILTLSNFGSQKLCKDDFPAEWTFLNSELKTVIEVMEDTELVGKFIFCLSILGVDRGTGWITKGLCFLHNVEGWFGKTGRWTDTDASIRRHYHTSWSAAVAMIDPVHTHSDHQSQYVQLWSKVVNESKFLPSKQVGMKVENLQAQLHAENSGTFEFQKESRPRTGTTMFRDLTASKTLSSVDLNEQYCISSGMSDSERDAAFLSQLQIAVIFTVTACRDSQIGALTISVHTTILACFYTPEPQSCSESYGTILQHQSLELKIFSPSAYPCLQVNQRFFPFERGHQAITASIRLYFLCFVDI